MVCGCCWYVVVVIRDKGLAFVIVCVMPNRDLQLLKLKMKTLSSPTQIRQMNERVRSRDRHLNYFIHYCMKG